MSGRRTHEFDVLVAGGGLVGLTTALLLRHHGVSTLLVERRSGSSPQPKARRFHVRSMEVFRQLGLAATVHEAARDLVGHDRMAAGRTLAEAEQLPLWLPTDESGEVPEVSPELPCLIAQDLLEPVLRAAAVDAGADVRFDTELVGFLQDDTGVSADLLDRVTGRSAAVRAGHLVAADGARSGVRQVLGIGRSGSGPIGEPSVNVYFRADLGEVVRGREFNLCHLAHPAAPGALASVDGRHRWVLMATADPGSDWPALLRTVLGVPAPDLEVLSVLPWQAEMLVADRYVDGRVLLAGDAAHVMPPWAASGANTGIADAHNLAWKLAALRSGGAGAALLQTYHAERQPAGWFAADESARRTRAILDRVAEPDPTLAHPFVLAAGGFQYREGALVPDPAEPPEPVTDFAPAGRIGTRVPHRWLDAAATRSTIDLAGPGWALLSGGPATAVPGDPHVPAARLEADFLPAGQHLLLRPDHVVAWRGTDPTEAPRIRDALLAASPGAGSGAAASVGGRVRPA